MPYFLTRDQVYRLLQRELPEDVYPDGPPSGFFSTADMDSVAGNFGEAYANLSDIYDNFFPQLAVDKLADWEVFVFGTPGDSSLTILERQNKVLAKLRAQNDISYDSIVNQLVDFFSGSGLDFDLVTWCGGQPNGGNRGAWVLEASQLDVETYLSFMDPDRAAGLTCTLDYAGAGITAQQLQEIQETAYTYEVRIIGHADASFLALLDATLTVIEPARSTHYIYNDFPGPVNP